VADMNHQDYGLSRPSFQLDPELDCTIFAGRRDVKDRMHSIISRILLSEKGGSRGVLIYGDYGSGKTHALHYFCKQVSKQGGVEVLPIFVPQLQVDARSTPSDLFRSIITAISPVAIFKLLSKIWDAHQDELHNDSNRRISMIRKSVQNSNLLHIIDKINARAPHTKNRDLVKKWLLGERCTSKEKRILGVDSDNSNVNTAAKTLLSLLKLFSQFEKRRVILLIDELETLMILPQRRLGDFQTFFNQLLGTEQDLITVLAITLDATLEDCNINRLLSVNQFIPPENIIYLKSFGEPRDVIEFMKELVLQLRPADVDISELVKRAKEETEETVQEDLFPFAAEALDLMCQPILESGSSLSPRNIENAATQCLGEAMHKSKRIITTKEVSRVMLMS